MISFSTTDLIIIILFLVLIVAIGFIAAKGKKKKSDDYLLSGRRVGIVLFVLTNVATWYGGILGVGEFSYRYGLVSWFTQGLPYYIFAFMFALFFADKIRAASLYTIPDKLYEVYGSKVSLVSAVLIFILVSPAPYMLILGQIFSIVFNIDYLSALVLSAIVASVYLIKGGYKSNIWADAFSFLVMFSGFIIIVFVAIKDYGTLDFLSTNLPMGHLTLMGNTSITFVIVWFLIALWTFTDPGFHQRCYSAGNGKIAKWGIVVSIGFWIFFDFLTNTTGLYSRAILPDLKNPVLAFPYLADTILSPGLKGLFFAALIATVLSTLNSFIFLSATTFSRDFLYRFNLERLRNSLVDKESYPNDALIKYTKYGIVITVLLSIITAYSFESVVELWYSIGSICIPGLILLVISSYYPKYRISNKMALIEILVGVLSSSLWLFIRSSLPDDSFFSQLEPMIVGLMFSIIIHVVSILIKT